LRGGRGEGGAQGFDRGVARKEVDGVLIGAHIEKLQQTEIETRGGKQTNKFFLNNNK